MCRLRATFDDARPPEPLSERLPAFTCDKLNLTTFVFEESDKWGENPLIYARIFSQTVVLIDTGCGGANQTPTIEGTLKNFLENVEIEANGNQPLNPGGKKRYTIICTHCHYDHVGGIPEFIGTPGLRLWASALEKSIIENQQKLPVSSLCSAVGMEVPRYTVTNWAEDGDHVTCADLQELGLVIYQTPGHTPDQVAIWDPQESFLYVGDTVYQDAPILFPNGGNIVQYRGSIKKLQTLVAGWNAAATADNSVPLVRVKIASGHNTKGLDAENFLGRVNDALGLVLAGKVRGVDITGLRYAWAGDEPAVEYRETADARVYFQGLQSVFSQLESSVEQ